MKENKSLGLKIPIDAHSTLKVFAAKKNISLISFSENLLIAASKNQELLEKIAQEILKK